jgi:hypothetical protein
MSDDLVTFSDDELAEYIGESPATDTISETAAPVVRERVTVHTAAPGRTYLMRAPKDWSWEDLRDYVVTQILKIHGPFPRNERKEYGIFKNFAARYGVDAGPIAQYAYERLDGIWMGSPTRVERFTKGCDQYFADEILKRLRAAR